MPFPVRCCLTSLCTVDTRHYILRYGVAHKTVDFPLQKFIMLWMASVKGISGAYL